jgi:hypothetical protein
LPPVFEE